jgi:hypothetical protein
MNQINFCGVKTSALPLLVATILARNLYYFRNIQRISDVHVQINILRQFNVCARKLGKSYFMFYRHHHRYASSIIHRLLTEHAGHLLFYRLIISYWSRFKLWSQYRMRNWCSKNWFPFTSTNVAGKIGLCRRKQNFNFWNACKQGYYIHISRAKCWWNN